MDLRLQKHVSSSLMAFKKAGIKVWVLTGDKQETALNISLTCGHISSDMHIFYLITKGRGDQTVLGEIIEKYLEDLEKDTENRKYALIVDGHALVKVLNNYPNEFIAISTQCSAVLCCRMSPLQKANIVKMIRLSKDKPITLAIGDGANDCSMIQEAHVGVGIIGNEGRQAALCSDFCFKKFYYLRQLLLVHGHYFYTRLAYTVAYFFYKNVLFIIPVVLYIFHSGLSPVTCYDATMLSCYNLTFTSLPILVYGIFEKRYEVKKLYDKPIFYKSLLRNSKLNSRTLVQYLFLACFQGICCFYFIHIAYNKGSINNSQMVVIDSREWNFLMMIAVLLSLLCFPVFYTFTSLIFYSNKGVFSNFFTDYFSLYNLYAIPQFWIVLIFMVPFMLLPPLFFQARSEDSYQTTVNTPTQPVFSVVSSECESENNDTALY